MQISTRPSALVYCGVMILSLLSLLMATGCGGDDVGVNGKQVADANGLLADGAIRGLDGAETDDAMGDAAIDAGDGVGGDSALGDAAVDDATDDAGLGHETGGDGAANDGAAADAGTTDAGTTDTTSTDTTSADTTSADTTSADTTSTDAGPTAKVPCTNNTVCKSAEFCALYYNNVAKYEGEGTPLKLPGWANVCEPDGAGKAQEGEACDPIAGDGDTTLKTCVNSSTCMQGTCTALCEEDAQCPSGTLCGVSEYGKKLPKASGDVAVAWLPIDLCVPMPGDKGACVSDADCSASKVCRPWVHRAGANFASDSRCVTPATGKQAFGGACGAKSSATGLGKLCDSTLCLYESGGTQPGVCTSTCDGAKDCPTTLTYNGTAFPTACVALLANHAGTETADDDVYIPHCIAVNEKSTLSDCAATRSCDGSQACRAYPIARGPAAAAKTEYLCVELMTKTQPKGPALDDGAACDPFAVDMACKGGYCLMGNGGAGYCSRLCKAGGGVTCGGGTKCDTSYALIPRKNGKNAATTGLCLK